jgi:transketolase
VVRPADARETVDAWRYALRRRNGPTLLVLTRQALPVRPILSGPAVPAPCGLTRVTRSTEGQPPRVIFAASGSEVALCCEAAALLEADGVASRVVSIPCLEEFAAAPAADRARILPGGIPRLFVEAGPGLSYANLKTDRDAFHGIARFGASAPGAEVARQLGLEPKAVAERARVLLG